MNWKRSGRTLVTLARQMGCSTAADLARFLKQIKQNDSIMRLGQ